MNNQPANPTYPLPQPVSGEAPLPNQTDSQKTPFFKSRKTVYLFIALAFLVLSAASLAFFTKNPKQTEPVPVQTTALPTPTPDPTADWETYTGETFPFEIKFPPYFEISATISEKNQVTVAASVNDPCNPDYPSFYLNINNDHPQPTKPLSSEPINVASYATRLETYELPENDHCLVRGIAKPDERQQARVTFTKDHLPWSLNFIFRRENTAEDLNLFRLILSTFRFLSGAQDEGSADYQTYANPTYHFSFNYPQDWEFQEVPLAGSRYPSLMINFAPEGNLPPPGTLPHIRIQITETIDKSYFSLYEWTNVTGNTTIGNIPTEERVHKTTGEKEVVFVSGNATFEIASESSNNDPAQSKAFTQILSTFRFLEPNTPPTSISPTPTVTGRAINYRQIPGWPLYDPPMAFSFQYPPDYNLPTKGIVDFMNLGQFYCAFSTTKKVGTGLDILSFKAIPKNYEDKVERTLKILNAPGTLEKEEVTINSFPATLLKLDQAYQHFKNDQAVIVETDSMLLIGRFQQNEVNQNWGYVLESLKIESDFNSDYFKENLNDCR